MTQAQYLALCEKYLAGNCTPQEELQMQAYRQQHHLPDDSWDAAQMGDQLRVKQLLYSKLQQSLHPSEVPVRSLHRWWYAAAAVLLCISISAYLFMQNNGRQQLQLTSAQKNTTEAFAPGTNKAVLTLANGKSIVLDNAGNGVLSKEGSAAISKTGNGLVVHNTGHAAADATTLNTISIPRGGKYDITLPDGTRVWLNSASSLTFPVAFSGHERKVTLTGEAYFEVAKNKKMPFRINVNNKQTVEVLGTHFNINAYADEGDMTTTLLEGSVKVNYGKISTLIKPGQMAVSSQTGNVDVKAADIEEVMAWKNDMFIFNNANIVTMMTSISRWYDVDVDFKGDMDAVNFTGNYSRSKGLSTLLKHIALMDKVKFEIKGRRITVIGK